MIVEAIFNVFQSTLEFLLSWLPNIPSISSSIIAGINSFTSVVYEGVGVVAYLYTPAVLTFVFAAILAILYFDNIYGFVLWLYHKIRG